MKRKSLYLSHPYGGKESNLEEVKAIMRMIAFNKSIREKFALVSPVTQFDFLYEEMSYENGLNLCLELLSVCDIMLLTGSTEDFNKSKGCNRELEFCKENGIKVIDLRDLSIHNIKKVLEQEKS